MEKKYSLKHIGKTHTTNEGYEAKVVYGGTKYGYCTIQIEDYITEVRFDDLKRGAVKYPYHPSVLNTGYVGVGKYSQITEKKLYNTWNSMLERCYNQTFHKKQPTYINATVCEKWLNLQVFAKWYIDNYTDGYHLDKDLLVPGNKQYSPETCIFIPQRLNNFLTNKQCSNTSGYTGVHWDKAKRRWVAKINIDGKRKQLGRFTTAEEASIAYQEARVIESNKLKELYKDVLPSNVLNQIR